MAPSPKDPARKHWSCWAIDSCAGILALLRDVEDREIGALTFMALPLVVWLAAVDKCL